MATSTIAAVKAALVSLLAARPGLHDVQVSYGPPLPNPGRELVWIGEVEGEQQVAGLGNQASYENYGVKVIISVLREGGDAQSADERCFEIFAELENEVRQEVYPVFGVAGVNAATIGAFTLEELASDTARESRLTVAVNVETRI